MARPNGEGEWGLIFCGGAMRNVFSAGVAWALWRFGFKGTFFKWIIGISGGSGVAAYYITDQVSEGRRIWLEEVPKGLIQVRWPILNLDFLTREVFQNRVPLDVARLASVATRFEIAVTDCKNGRAEYLDAKTMNAFDAIKASCALFPFHGPVSRSGGKRSIDGGIANPIPINRMINEGMRKILVVLPSPIGERAAPIHPILHWVARKALSPRAARAYYRSSSRYNNALLALRQPLNGVKIVTVAPLIKTPAGRLTRDPRLLEATMQMGDDAMRDAIERKEFP